MIMNNHGDAVNKEMCIHLKTFIIWKTETGLEIYVKWTTTNKMLYKIMYKDFEVLELTVSR
jgi:hypothetical protein